MPPPGVPTSVIRSPLTLPSPGPSSSRKVADKPEVEAGTIPRPLTNNALKSINFVPGGARGVYILTMNAPFTFLRGVPEKFSTVGAPINLTDEPNFSQSMVSFPCFILLISKQLKQLFFNKIVAEARHLGFLHYGVTEVGLPG